MAHDVAQVAMQVEEPGLQGKWGCPHPGLVSFHFKQRNPAARARALLLSPTLGDGLRETSPEKSETQHFPLPPSHLPMAAGAELVNVPSDALPA